MNLKHSLTLRYAVALFLVATILIFTHSLSLKQISATAGSGNLIDISGKQRMLSQRIGLLSQGLLFKDMEHYAGTSESLDLAIKEMRSNHDLLRDDWEKSITRGETNFYKLLAPGALSDSVEQFLKEAQRVNENFTGNERISDGRKQAAQAMIVKAQSTDFLNQLDGVVKLYAAYNQQASDELSRIQKISLYIGLGILFFEIILIFRPMVARIVKCIDALDDANEELKDMAMALADGLQRPIVDSKSLIKVVENSLSSGKVIEASKASEHIYSSMVTMEGIVGELIEALDRQRRAVVRFTGIGSEKGK